MTVNCSRLGGGEHCRYSFHTSFLSHELRELNPRYPQIPPGRQYLAVMRHQLTSPLCQQTVKSLSASPVPGRQIPQASYWRATRPQGAPGGRCVLADRPSVGSCSLTTGMRRPGPARPAGCGPGHDHAGAVNGDCQLGQRPYQPAAAPPAERLRHRGGRCAAPRRPRLHFLGQIGGPADQPADRLSGLLGRQLPRARSLLAIWRTRLTAVRRRSAAVVPVSSPAACTRRTGRESLPTAVTSSPESVGYATFAQITALSARALAVCSSFVPAALAHNVLIRPATASSPRTGWSASSASPGAAPRHPGGSGKPPRHRVTCPPAQDRQAAAAPLEEGWPPITRAHRLWCGT